MMLVVRYAGRLLRVLLLFHLCLLILPFLVVVARSWRGRLLGLVAATGAFLVPHVWLRLFGDLGVIAHTAVPNWYSNLFPTVVAALAVCEVALLAFLPRRTKPGIAGLASVGPWPALARPDRWPSTRASVVPDTDLIRVGVMLVTRLDPLMSRAEARTVRRVTARLLAEMDADAHYVHTYSPILLGPLSLANRDYDYGHHFLVVPQRATWDDLPGLIVFLHGHGGNTTLMPHVWRRFAEDQRFVLACPSFGYGNWEHPEAVRVIERCVAGVLGEVPIDPARVYLAGISQGGCGVGRAAAAMPDAFRGLVFLSPTLEPDVLGSAAFADGWRGRPAFVAQGGRDHNVRPHTVDAGVKLMRESGVDVTYHFDADADHFLFFAKLDEMQRRIAEWMAGVEGRALVPSAPAGGRPDRDSARQG